MYAGARAARRSRSVGRSRLALEAVGKQRENAKGETDERKPDGREGMSPPVGREGESRALRDSVEWRPEDYAGRGHE